MLEFLKVTRTTLGAAKRVMLAQLRGVGDEGDDESAEPVDAAEIFGMIGLMVRPFLTAHTEAVAFRVGDQVVVLNVNDKSLSVFNDVAEGETRLYGAKEPSARLRLRDDGSADLEVKTNMDLRITVSGSGNVIFNGGSTPVAKEGSITTGHTHGAGALVAGPYAVTGITASSTDTVATGAGTPHVKVP